MKEYTLYYFHDPENLLIIDTIVLEAIQSVQTGISKEIKSYGLLMDEDTEQISIWHEDKMQKLDEKTLTLSDPSEYKPDSIAAIYKDARSKIQTWKCTEVYDCYSKNNN